MLDELTALLKLEILFHQLILEKKNLKAWKKALLKMRSYVAVIFRVEIIDDLLEQKGANLRNVLENHVQEYLNIVPTAKQLSDDGAQGMFLHKGEIIPLYIKVESKEDRDWAIANQRKFEEDCINCYMFKHGIQAATVTIILFQNKGFSGLRYTLTADRRVDLIGR